MNNLVRRLTVRMNQMRGMIRCNSIARAKTANIWRGFQKGLAIYSRRKSNKRSYRGNVHRLLATLNGLR